MSPPRPPPRPTPFKFLVDEELSKNFPPFILRWPVPSLLPPLVELFIILFLPLPHKNQRPRPLPVANAAQTAIKIKAAGSPTTTDNTTAVADVGEDVLSWSESNRVLYQTNLN